MFELRQSAAFESWFAALRDAEAKRKIAARLVRIESGLLGDVESVGEGVSELRIHHGPGYRSISRSEERIGNPALRRRQVIPRQGHRGGETNGQEYLGENDASRNK